MDITNYKPNKQKNKHLSTTDIELIVNELIKHKAVHANRVRNTGKTDLVKSLSKQFNTTVSNIYNIEKAASITVLNTQLEAIEELSASAAISQRTRKGKSSNYSKLNKASDFINIVISKVKDRTTLDSIDEAVNYLKLHCKDEIEGMDTVCTKTIYNYVHSRKIDLKPIDLPKMCGWKKKVKPKDKLALTKNQKGTPITQRPFEMDDRSEFGHWEGDLVTGPRDGKRGAYLTLIERQTRKFIMMHITHKSSKQVYMQINKLEKQCGDHFSTIFKSITFDNGNEFARHKDIEMKPGTSTKRTSVYFATPYCSYERGSNENCNGLIRRFIKKGTDINLISKDKTKAINTAINQKNRKILGYLSADNKFAEQLEILNINSGILG